MQPNAAVTAPSAMRAAHERGSHQVQQPHTRSWRPAALSTAAQCCCRRADAPASHKKPAPSCPQRCSPMLLSPIAMHAQHERDSRQVRQRQRAASRQPQRAALSAAAQCRHRRAGCHAHST
eukprot:11960-Prymnesium_polylepis.1